MNLLSRFWNNKPTGSVGQREYKAAADAWFNHLETTCGPQWSYKDSIRERTTEKGRPIAERLKLASANLMRQRI